MISSSRSMQRLRKFHNNNDRLVPGIEMATESFRYIQKCQMISPQASTPGSKQQQQQVVQYRRSGQYYRFSGPRTLTNEEKETMFREKARNEKLLEASKTTPDAAPKTMTASAESDKNDEKFECRCEAECEFDCLRKYEHDRDDDSVGIVSSANSCEEEHRVSRKRSCGELSPENEAAQDDDATTTPTDVSVVEALRRLYHPARMVRRRLASDDSTLESTPDQHELKSPERVDPGVAVVTPTKALASVVSLPENSPVVEEHPTIAISGSDDDTVHLLLDGTGYHDGNDDGCCYDLDLEITELFSNESALEWDNGAEGGEMFEDGEIPEEEINKEGINSYDCGDKSDEATIGTAIALDATAISTSYTIGLPSLDSVNAHGVLPEKMGQLLRKRTYADSFGE